jgi:hypothetical protein
MYFQNQNSGSIYWNTQQFKTIKFIANGYDILEYDYATLLYNNSKSILGYELPKGIFEIKYIVADKWKNLSKIDNLTVELNGIMVPPDIGFAICAESINWMVYDGKYTGIFFSN